MSGTKQQFGIFRALVILLSVVGIWGYLSFVVVIIHFGWPAEYYELLTEHFAAIVGLPMAAALASILVALMPSKFSRIEFQAMGVTFKGGSAPIILWVVCFIVIALAIKLAW